MPRSRNRRQSETKTMATKINLPTFNESKSYELYKQELNAWNEITELHKKKRGIAVALTLPEDVLCRPTYALYHVFMLVISCYYHYL